MEVCPLVTCTAQKQSERQNKEEDSSAGRGQNLTKEKKIINPKCNNREPSWNRFSQWLKQWYLKTVNTELWMSGILRLYGRHLTTHTHTHRGLYGNLYCWRMFLSNPCQHRKGKLNNIPRLAKPFCPLRSEWHCKCPHLMIDRYN